MNFQMFKLDLEKTEEPEIKLPKSTEKASLKQQKHHWKIKTVKENIYFCFIDSAKAFTVWITINWKILKEMGIPDQLTYLMRNLYAGQVRKQQLELDMEQQTGSK